MTSLEERNFDTKRYEKMCDKFGRKVVDDWLERYDAWAADKPQKARAHHNKVAAVQNWMRRDGVEPRPGWGVSAGPSAPTCEKGHKVKWTHDEALCMDCGREWRLVAGKWALVTPPA